MVHMKRKTTLILAVMAAARVLLIFALGLFINNSLLQWTRSGLMW